MDFPAAAGRGFLVVLGSVYVAVFSAACLIVPARHLIVQVSIGKFIDEDSVSFSVQELVIATVCAGKKKTWWMNERIRGVVRTYTYGAKSTNQPAVYCKRTARKNSSTSSGLLSHSLQPSSNSIQGQLYRHRLMKKLTSPSI